MRAILERDDAVARLAEVFRRSGYEGATLSLITARTGIGKGSLYHFFPGGKEAMAEAVLAAIAGWFETEVFAPLRTAEDPRAGIRAMLAACDAYFASGRRVCLVGAFALAESRDRFASEVNRYFRDWTAALATALRRAGLTFAAARAAAEENVALLQGALVLARALDDPGVFARALRRMRERLA